MVFILRRPLVDMLQRGRLKRLKAGPSGLEVEYFDEKLQEARAELGENPVQQAEPVISPAPPMNGQVVRDDFLDEMRQLAEVAPSAVILESFARLERTLRDAVESNAEARRPASIVALARQAVEQGLLTDSEFAAFKDITVLRNVVAHTSTANLDAERALEYAAIARQLIIAIALASGRTAADGPPG